MAGDPDSIKMGAMESLSPLRRACYAWLGRSYALMHAIQCRSLLGIRLITFVRWLPVIILLFGWRRHWPFGFLLFLAIMILWINFSLWRARRNNYHHFIADNAPSTETDALDRLPANRKIAVAATGLFSVSGRENTLLLRPANYWRVPLGEHIVMVEERPSKFLYQFFSAESLQEVRSGWLLHGPRPIESLAVTFLARWGPDYTRFGQTQENGDEGDLPPPRRITVYLSTADADTRHMIWHSINGDARPTRRE